MESLQSLLPAFTAWFTASETPSKLVASVLLVMLAMLCIRAASRYYRSRGSGTAEKKRTAFTTFRNGVLLFMLFLLLFIWGGQLRHFALSVAALAAAMAIASKEFVMSLLGSAMWAILKPYSVGDEIEVAGVRGEVLNIDLLSTTLLEHDANGFVTGNITRFPNMILLQNAVHKVSATGSYGLDSVRVALDPHDDISLASSVLQQAAEEVCADWIEQADQHFRIIEGANLMALPSSRPVLRIESIDAKRVDIVVRYASPSNRRGSVGQAILRRYYALMQAARQQAADPAPNMEEQQR
ncbi:MAG: mechanosensitive ion channel family protein [Pigmentiphaga sp.]|nr:mechanosensitive ion channel family protein [Pigmentiphaga sp.]